MLQRIYKCSTDNKHFVSHNSINERNLDLWRLLTQKKNLIDSERNWDRAKKITNEYEMVSFFSQESKRFFPISRSYYKMTEILLEFDFHKRFGSGLTCACICEGPGGFVQAIDHYTKRFDIHIKPISCISLVSNDKRVPRWRLENNTSYKIHYGLDLTGDIYNKSNIDHFVGEVGESTCDFVTGDGGFDFSDDFNSQETSFQTLLLCEILTIFKLQKNGGMCVLKIFDVFDKTSIQLMSVIMGSYASVYFVKPKTSRPANSEKYLVCDGYVKNNKIIDILGRVLSGEKTLDDVCDAKTYEITLRSVFEYNKLFVSNQIWYIQTTLDYLSEGHDMKNNYNEINNILCREWVAKYMPTPIC